jgi:hypothetical protein
MKIHLQEAYQKILKEHDLEYLGVEDTFELKWVFRDMVVI